MIIKFTYVLSYAKLPYKLFKLREKCDFKWLLDLFYLVGTVNYIGFIT